MKIYYATSIRGGGSPETAQANIALIDYLKKFGKVLTEHFAEAGIKDIGETEITDVKIHDRDMQWIETADVIVAEVSNPSLGVGYEIGRGIEKGKRILCLRNSNAKKLSAMISGCSELTVKNYDDIEDAKGFIDAFFAQT